MEIGSESNGKTIVIKDVRTIMIRLPGNPTTGFSWMVASVQGDAVRVSGDVQYIPDATPTPRVGSGGTFEIPLRVAAKGQAVVTLEYRRPWEKDRPADRSFTVTLNIEALR